MTKANRSVKVMAARLAADVEAENRKLRLQVEQLQDQVREERRRADKHADEIALLRQQQAEWARRRLNGVAA